MEEKRRGEKWYNGKQDSRPARRRTSKWAAYAHRDGSPAIMENRVRIDGTSGAKREISVLDRFRLAIGPFKEDSIRRLNGDGQTDRLFELVVCTRVSGYLTKRLRFTESTRESGFNRNPSRSS